jgi:large subunit ribosomal protein L7Ae
LIATQLFRLLNKYRPETPIEKRQRLKSIALAKTGKAEGTEAGQTKRPLVVKFGLNHVTALIEAKKAQLVVIAHDVEPIELVVWLPALCRKMDVPYCIVKSKARLGTVVHMKTATALALTGVRPEHKHEFTQLVQAIRANYNEKYDEIRRQWGGGILGSKSQIRIEKVRKAVEKERIAKQLG